jgi:cation transport ATPase
MNEHIQTARELATHAADIAHLQSDMDKLVESVAIMQKTLTDIDKTLSEAKGGWRILVGIAGASGLAGATLTQIAHWWAK